MTVSPLSEVWPPLPLEAWIMQARNFDVLIALTSLVWMLSACSSYEVQDIFRPVGAHPEYHAENVELTVMMAPGTRLFLTGPIGLPVIPTNLGSDDKNIINLKMVLELRKEHEFSFLLRPCLHGPLNNTLFPVSAVISAVAMKQDDGSMYKDKQKRWDMLGRLSRPGDININFSSDPKVDRISRDQIYTHYGYSGQRWDSLQVDILYRYECKNGCPNVIEVDASDLAYIDSVPPLNGKFKFVRLRENEYHVLAPL